MARLTRAGQVSHHRALDGIIGKFRRRGQQLQWVASCMRDQVMKCFGADFERGIGEHFLGLRNDAPVPCLGEQPERALADGGG